MAAIFHLTTGVVYVRGWSGSITGGTTLAADGTAAAPSYSFANSPTTGFYLVATDQVNFTSNSAAVLRFNASGLTSTAVLQFGATLGAPDVILTRDAANTLAQRNGTNAQVFNIYNTYSSAGANYERLRIGVVTNRYKITQEQAGTGSQRAIDFDFNTYQFQNNGTVKFAIDADSLDASAHLLFNADNTYDIGATSDTRPRTVYAGTGVSVNNGTAVLNSSGQLKLVAAAGHVAFGNTADNFLQRNGAGDMRLGTSAGSVDGGLSLGSITTGSSSTAIFFGTRGPIGMFADGQFQTSNNAQTVQPIMNGTLTTSVTSTCTIADTSETDLWTYSLPATTLSADNRGVRVTVFGTFAATANTKTIRSYVASTDISATGNSGAFNNLSWRMNFTVIRSGASAEIYESLTNVSTSTIGVRVGTLTEATSGAMILKVTGQNGTAAANDICVKGAIVETIK